MKRLVVILTALLILASSAGCFGEREQELQDGSVGFETRKFINPADPEDGYMAIEYNGRTYLPYGTVKTALRDRDLGACLGYIVQDGVPDENLRVYLLADDPDANWLVEKNVKGFMDQPVFLRAADTAGKDIEIPDFVGSLGYDYWE